MPMPRHAQPLLLHLRTPKPNLVEDDNKGEVNGGSCEGGQQARLGEQLILPSQPAP
jgi:hypothetical protein